MDDPAVFGPIAYECPASRAIAEGWVDDYAVAVIGVRRQDVMPLLSSGMSGGTAAVTPVGEALHRAVVQTALVHAAAEYGLRRVLVFTARVAEADEFATSLPATLGPRVPGTHRR